MRVMKYAAISITVVVLAVLAVSWIAQRVFIATFVTPAFEEVNGFAVRNIDAWLEDVEQVAAHPFFSTPRSEKDAGPYLNPLVPWVSGGIDIGRWENGSTTFKMLGDSADLLRTFPDGITDEPRLNRIVKTLDFGWMEKLTAYCYWETGRHSPIAEASEVNAAMAPTPSYAELMQWAKLRLWRGRMDAELDTALVQVRHLAWLSVSTETLVGAMVGLAVLNTAQVADNRWGIAAEKPFMTWEDTRRFRRTLFAAAGFTQASVDADVVRRALQSKGPGACLAITETASMQSLTWPVSLDVFAAHGAQLVAAIEHPPAHCRLTLARDIYDKVGKRERSLAETLTRSNQALELDETGLMGLKYGGWMLPGMEATVVKALFAIAQPGFVGKYEAERANPPPPPDNWLAPAAGP